ncbi:MAG: O-antigen ligase family protein [candidate division KSB1 bacterium]|jgi:O-antigen ligase|nr:O-antigen ligase family protein [candidate division KSB1 bacterium]
MEYFPLHREEHQLDYSSSIVRWLIVFAAVAEIFLLYLFAIKDAGMLGIVLVVGMASAIVIFFCPRIGVLFVIGLIYSNLAAVVGGGIFKLIVLFTMIAWLINNFMSDPKFVSHRVNVIILIFSFFALISLVSAASTELAIEALMNYLKSMILYFLVIHLIDTPRLLRYAFWVIVIAAGVTAVYGMSTFMSDPFMSSRVSSFREDPNNLAIVLVTAVPISVSLIKTEKRLISKIILAAIGMAILITINLTYSRGGMLALGVVLMALLYNERKNKVFAVISVIVLIIVVYLFVEKLSHYQKLLRLVTEDQSFIQRYRLYRGGIRMFLDHPVFGVGLGNFIVWSTRYTGLIMALYAHNIFLHIGAETGIGGLLAYIFIFYLAWRSVKKAGTVAMEKNNPVLLNYAFGIKVSLLGFTIAGLFLSQHFNKALWVILGLCIAIEVICGKDD